MLSPKMQNYMMQIADVIVGCAGYSLARHAEVGIDLTAGGMVMFAALGRLYVDYYNEVMNRKNETVYSGTPESVLMARAIAEGQKPEVQKPIINDYAKVNHGGLVFQNLAVKQTIDHEREFCKTLVNMKQVDGEMDISETYWLKGGHWQKINVQLTPQDFKDMRAKYEYHKIVGKRGGASNSPYVVLNEHAIVQKALGKLEIPLPQ